MKASEAPLLKLLQTHAQFVIPLYQRTYSWTAAQCERMWDDILAVGNQDDNVGHFIGSVVYLTDPGPTTQIGKLVVIDGQQRLTTLTLILLAVRDHISVSRDESVLSVDQITDYYLSNRYEKGMERYKLLLTQSDRDTLRSLIDRAPMPPVSSRRIQENYSFFVDRLSSATVDLGVVYRGLLKLMVVDVALDPRADNPQLIFESLNSTGLALTQADLIRNYVLMGQSAQEQEQLYVEYWSKMEQSFGQANYATHFDAFMRHYLTLKLGRIPRISDVYAEFKMYAGQSRVSVREVVADVHRYSGHYVTIALKGGTDKAIQSRLDDINELKIDTAYPLLLETFDDYARGAATRDDVLGVLDLIASYVLRRAICGIPTNTLNQTFQRFSRSMDKSRYLESAKAAFQLLDGVRRYPSDLEFRRDFVTRDIYNLAARRNYILRKLENHERLEPINVESFTIEHVMPQNENLSSAWRNMLGPDWKRIQAEYLHTIGNLTLTGYNSQLSDRPFAEKRTIAGGFDKSPIWLNGSLALLDRWDEAAIRRRADQLADLAVIVWPGTGLSEEVLAGYKQETAAKTIATATLADHPVLQGEVMALFEQLRSRILNLDPSVTEEIRKSYIAYKMSTNFVDVAPRSDRLKVTLNMRFDEIADPEGRAWDHGGKRYQGNGDVGFHVKSPDDLDYGLYLIKQSFEKYRDDVDG